MNLITRILRLGRDSQKGLIHLEPCRQLQIFGLQKILPRRFCFSCSLCSSPPCSSPPCSSYSLIINQANNIMLCLFDPQIISYKTLCFYLFQRRHSTPEIALMALMIHSCSQRNEEVAVIVLQEKLKKKNGIVFFKTALSKLLDTVAHMIMMLS